MSGWGIKIKDIYPWTHVYIWASFMRRTIKKVTDNFLVLFQDELGWSIDTIDLSINQTTNARNISQDILHPDS